jgi:hypothetical protein
LRILAIEFGLFLFITRRDARRGAEKRQHRARRGALTAGTGKAVTHSRIARRAHRLQKRE